MPPPPSFRPARTIDEVVEAVGAYPREAYEFVHEGLHRTVTRLHGEAADPTIDRHVSGSQLCAGLRDYAVEQWGLLARTVLRKWNVRRTIDFGRIVFALVDHGYMSKTDRDSLRDFRNVFDFESAFEKEFRIVGTDGAGNDEPCRGGTCKDKT